MLKPLDQGMACWKGGPRSEKDHLQYNNTQFKDLYNYVDHIQYNQQHIITVWMHGTDRNDHHMAAFSAEDTMKLICIIIITILFYKHTKDNVYYYISLWYHFVNLEYGFLRRFGRPLSGAQNWTCAIQVWLKTLHRSMHPIVELWYSVFVSSTSR